MKVTLLLSVANAWKARTTPLHCDRTLDFARHPAALSMVERCRRSAKSKLRRVETGFDSASTEYRQRQCGRNAIQRIIDEDQFAASREIRLALLPSERILNARHSLARDC
jgi:hypothetical protein